MAFLTIIWRFPTTFRRFPKIFQNCSEAQDVPEYFPKISKDCRRLSRKYKYKYNLRDKLDICEIIDIFTCEDVVSFLSICYHLVYHWLLYNKMTPSYSWNLLNRQMSEKTRQNQKIEVCTWPSSFHSLKDMRSNCDSCRCSRSCFSVEISPHQSLFVLARCPK